MCQIIKFIVVKYLDYSVHTVQWIDLSEGLEKLSDRLKRYLTD